MKRLIGVVGRGVDGQLLLQPTLGALKALAPPARDRIGPAVTLRVELVRRFTLPAATTLSSTRELLDVQVDPGVKLGRHPRL